MLEVWLMFKTMSADRKTNMTGYPFYSIVLSLNKFIGVVCFNYVEIKGLKR